LADLRDPTLSAEAVIRALDLRPHPEGGHYRETWRDQPDDGGRGAATAIHFLLRAEDVNQWHRVDAAELWIWQAGAPLELTMSPDGHETETQLLGSNPGLQQSMQVLVPRSHWQRAACLGNWTLACCVVAPAFRFEGFELAPPDWQPSPQQ
jgi:predicted cupin superfamily sugar epimerase